MGDRVLWSPAGHEVTIQDLMDMQRLRDKFLQEKVLHRFFNNLAGIGFFEDDGKVVSAGGMALNISQGLGFQWDATESNEDEPKLKAINIPADEPITVPAADPANPRIDIAVIKADRLASESESRFILDAGGNITSQSINTKDNDHFAFQYLDGTPAASPVEPSVPTGYEKIATVNVAAGVASLTDNDITDNRTILFRGELVSTGKHTFKHEQASPASTWIINHNLGNIDHIVQLIDENGDNISAQISRGVNQDTVTMIDAISGKALLLAIL